MLPWSMEHGASKGSSGVVGRGFIGARRQSSHLLAVLLEYTATPLYIHVRYLVLHVHQLSLLTTTSVHAPPLPRHHYSLVSSHGLNVLSRVDELIRMG